MRSPQQRRRSIQRWAARPEPDYVIPSLLCFTRGITTKDTKVHDGSEETRFRFITQRDVNNFGVLCFAGTSLPENKHLG